MRQRAMYKTSTGLILIHYEERPPAKRHLVVLQGDAGAKTLYDGRFLEAAQLTYQAERAHYAEREKNAAAEKEDERIRTGV